MLLTTIIGSGDTFSIWLWLKHGDIMYDWFDKSIDMVSIPDIYKLRSYNDWYSHSDFYQCKG